MQLDDSKTGKSIRPLGAAALALLKSIDKQDSSDFVFSAERGDGHHQGMKGVWSKAIEKAELPGVTPHTLRRTMGSTSISTGEALALTGAILGHANPRSTALYAHVQNDPSKRAANRVTKRIAAALAGKPANEKQSRSTKQRRPRAEADGELIRMLAQRLAEDGPDAVRLREAISESIGQERFDDRRANAKHPRSAKRPPRPTNRPLEPPRGGRADMSRETSAGATADTRIVGCSLNLTCWTLSRLERHCQIDSLDRLSRIAGSDRDYAAIGRTSPVSRR